MLRRWRDIAYAARYGHQQITTVLGRSPTTLELQLFIACVDELRRGEAPDIAGVGIED